ncbi:MAG: DUF177 domain-containing protein [Alkalilacustris sp.]
MAGSEAMQGTELRAGLADLPVSAALRVARLPKTRPTEFDLVPDAAALQALAGLVGATHLRKLRFQGALRPLPGGGWQLEAHLGATVVQPCRVTLVPVTTRIEEDVERRYLPDLVVVEADEAVLPEDVDAERLPEMIDPAAVMIEALALAVPDYPRAPDAESAEAVFAAPGVVPLRDADLHPMAGLAALRDRLRRD